MISPVDAACGDEVARLDDKVLHANSIREKSAALNAKSRGSLGRLRASDPALPPALRPAFKVRRGRRSTCAAMCRHAPPIPNTSLRDFKFCVPQNERRRAGSWFLPLFEIEPTTDPLKDGPSDNEGLNLFIEGGRISGKM